MKDTWQVEGCLSLGDVIPGLVTAGHAHGPSQKSATLRLEQNGTLTLRHVHYRLVLNIIGNLLTDFVPPRSWLMHMLFDL